ncbi:glycerophosphodiester phosphodiesterase family protein [Alkalibacillus almallahensis]|uniref:glycerophosphodiester phosphodiesterase family protein n=1 Tax=Alkalibacillus almallahensis TaxID=1379154 RepID=UPI0014201D27|nr:glycerophosphodiester phosphodiesterase family protein [Alkalibacillus almallahensis]NIK12068.1 glycerophosphoryl diester phosphodiesterase [Alkalibacillus almallahensis]
MFRLFKRSLDDFKTTYPQHLAFAIFYMLLTSFIFVPVASIFFNRILVYIDAPTLINNEVYSVALSYTGISILILVGLIVFILLFIQFAVFIVIAQKQYFKKPITVANALITGFARAKKLLSISVLPLILVLLLLTPFIRTPLNEIVYDLNMSILYSGHLSLSYVSLAVYFSILMFVLYIILRWIFVIHFIVIEKNNVRHAIKRSMKLTKRHQKSILINVLSINVLIVVASTFILYLLSLIPNVMTGTIIGELIEHYLVTITSIIATLSTLVLIPVNVIMLTRLFYQYKHEEEQEVTDDLELSRSIRLAVAERKAYSFFRRRRLLISLLVIVYVTGVFAYNQTISGNLVYLDWNVEVAAHRGDSKNAPENSMSAVESAIEQGLNVVEVDVQLTRDNVLVLHHDKTLLRTAGAPERVSDLTYNELRTHDIGSSFSEEFAGESIPRLEDVFEVAQEAGVKLLLDVKPDENEEALARNLAILLEEKEMIGETYVQSFNNQFLQSIRDENEEIEIGQIVFTAVGDLSRLDVDFYTVHQTMLSDDLVNELKRDGYGIWVWSTNIDRTANQVLQYDVDGIITKTPDVVLRMIEIRQ